MVGVKVKDVEGPFVEAPYLGAVSSIGVLNVNQGMLRTSVLHTVGGFSERFRDYGIDPDLTAKVLFSGWDVAYTRVVGLQHYRAWAEGGEASGPQRERQRRLRQAVRRRSGAPTRRLTASGGFDRAPGRPSRRRPACGSTRRGGMLGLDGRDWCNVLTGRYISPLDPILTRGQPYHLIQRAPAIRRALPPDPA